MNQSTNEMNNKTKSGKIILIGVIISILWIILSVSLGLNFLLTNLGNKDGNTFIFGVFITCGGILTSFHIWSRVPIFPEKTPMRNLFILIGFTFVPTIFIFTIQIVDYILGYNGIPGIFSTINSLIGTIEFNFFGIEQFRTTMPADSIVIFEFIMISIMFYIFPMERFVNKQPWRVYLLLIMIILIPFYPLIVTLDPSEMVISIITAVIVLYVVYCFIYLFYLYFSTSLRASGTLRQGGIYVAFGLLLLIITWILGWFVQLISDLTPTEASLIQYSTGTLALLMFNYGFYILRPSS